MKIIEIKEYEEIAHNLLSEGDKRHLEASIKLRKIPNLVEWQLKTLKFKQFVGILPLKDSIIEIYPKIHDEQSNQDCREMLLDMLYTVRRVKLSCSGVAGLALSKKPLLEIFIRHFCEELFVQVHRGLIHQYQIQEQNMTILKGRLLVNEHIRQNTVHRERLFCQFDEFSVDNAYNQILKAALYYLKTLSRDVHNQKLITQLLPVFDQVSLVTVAKGLGAKIKLTRLTQRYAMVLEWANLFLQEQNMDVMTGSRIHGPTILFDMNKLFEEYIAQKFTALSPEFPDIKVTAQQEKTFIRSGDQSIFKAKPDLLLFAKNSSERPLLIIDTKWKRLEDRANFGIDNSDIYQMISYARIFQCQKIVLIYPENKPTTHLADKFTTLFQFHPLSDELTIDVFRVDLSKFGKLDVNCQIRNLTLYMKKITIEKIPIYQQHE